MIGTFESYASGINKNNLQKIAGFIGIVSPTRYKKSELIFLIETMLKDSKAELKMFSPCALRRYGNFNYIIGVLRHFEKILNVPHEVSDEIARLWKICMTEDEK